MSKIELTFVFKKKSGTTKRVLIRNKKIGKKLSYFKLFNDKEGIEDTYFAYVSTFEKK